MLFIVYADDAGNYELLELFHIYTLDDKKSADTKENEKISTVVNHVTL